MPLAAESQVRRKFQRYFSVREKFERHLGETALPQSAVAESPVFAQWYAERAKTQGLHPDPDHPDHHYDYRAAHAAGAEPDERGHWPSRFKRATHPNLVVSGVDTKTGQAPRRGSDRGLTVERPVQEPRQPKQRKPFKYGDVEFGPPIPDEYKTPRPKPKAELPTGIPETGDRGVLEVSHGEPLAVRRQREPRTWFETAGAGKVAGARITNQLVRYFHEQVSNLSYDLGMGDVPKTGFVSMAERVTKDYVEDHPTWTAERAKGIGDLLSSPKKLVGMVAETAPYMAGAAAAFAAGGPLAAFVFAYAVEGQGAYDEAIQAGASEDQARTARNIHGTIAAAIEVVQIGRMFKFAKGGRTMFKNAVAQRVMQKMAASGMAGRVTAEVVNTIPFLVREGLEEVLQGTSQELTALGVYGKPVEPGWFDRRAQEFAGGAVAYGVFGVGGRVARAGLEAAPAEEGVVPEAPTLERPVQPQYGLAPGEVKRQVGLAPGAFAGEVVTEQRPPQEVQRAQEAEAPSPAEGREGPGRLRVRDTAKDRVEAQPKAKEEVGADENALRQSLPEGVELKRVELPALEAYPHGPFPRDAEPAKYRYDVILPSYQARDAESWLREHGFVQAWRTEENRWHGPAQLAEGRVEAQPRAEAKEEVAAPPVKPAPKPADVRQERRTTKAVAEPVPAEAEYGASNKLITKERYEAAKKRFGETTLYTGIPLDKLGNLVEMGLYHFEAMSIATGRWAKAKYGDWRNRMIAEYGDEVAPHLRKVWRGMGDKRDDMTRTHRAAEIQERQPGPAKGQREPLKAIGVKAGETRAQLAEKAALKRKLSGQAALAATAYAEGRVELRNAQETLLDLADDLPLQEQARFAGRIVRARTVAGMKSLARELDTAHTLRHIPGLAKEPKIATEPDLLKYALKKAQRVSAGAYLAGAKDVVRSHQDLLEYAEGKLPKAELGRLAKHLARARTQSELRRATAAIDILAEHYETRTALKGFKNALKKLDIRHLRPPQQTKARTLLDSIQIGDTAGKTLRRMESLLKHLEIDEDAAVPPVLIAKARRILSQQDATPLWKLSPDAIRSITKALQNIAHVSATKNKLIFSRRHKSAREAIDTAAAQVDAYNAQRTYALPAGQFQARARQNALFRLLTWDQLSGDTKTEILASRKSVAREILHDNLQEGEREFARVQSEALDEIRGTMKKLSVTWKDIKRWSHAANRRAKTVAVSLPTATTSDGSARVESVEMTPAELGEFLNAASDPSTRHQMVQARMEGIGFRRNPGGEPVKLTLDDVKAIEKAAREYPQITALAEAMKQYLNGPLRPVLNDAWEAEHGFVLAERTDYWPRKRDKEFRETDPSKSMQYWVERTLEDQGIFKPRTGGAAPILIGDMFDTFVTHVNRVAAYVGKHRATTDAMRMLDDHTFRQAVRRRLKRGNDLLDDLRKTVVSYRGMDYVSQGTAERVVRGMLGRMHVGALGLKPHIMLYQPVSYITAMTEISPKHLAKVWNWRRPGNKETEAEIFKWSPVLRERYEGTGIQIMSPYAGGTTMETAYRGSERGGLQGVGMWGIRHMDRAAITNLWRAAKSEAKAAGLEGDSLMERTARRAEEIVARTQPTWDALSISAIAREGRQSTIHKILALFSSQRNKNLNIAVRGMVGYEHSDKGPKATARLLRDVGIPVFITSGLVFLIREGYFAALGAGRRWLLDDEEKLAQAETAKAGAIDTKKAEKAQKKIDKIRRTRFRRKVTGMVSQVMGNWLIGGELASTVFEESWGAAEGKPIIFAEARRNPLGEALSDLVQASAYTAQAIDQAATGAKYKSGPRKDTSKARISAWRAAMKALRVISTLGGVPIQGPMQAVEPALPHRRTPKK